MNHTIIRIQNLPITLKDANLEGFLKIPELARGIVVFVHGSGSSRFSPRNLFVADYLYKRGLATFSFDLLTEEEAQRDADDARLRFDIPFLSNRLVNVLDWLADKLRKDGFGLPVGLFGASTGAAAALMAAVERPNLVKAIVSRGGRPDLAALALGKVQAPTLLIVGGNDAEVLELNQEAYASLKAPKQLFVVQGAAHLFEEPGTLEEVAHMAADWFEDYLGD